MNLIQRVQDILLKPKDTWPAIAQESADTASIYKDYLMIVAAVPAIATFIGLSLVGAGAFGFSIRVPLVTGLMNMVVGYVLTLVAVFLVSLITDALAPTFGGTKSPVSALKVVAYGSTAGFLGGLFNLLPSLSVLGLLAALYSIYLIYTGLPVLMKCPPEKAAGYTAVVVVCSIVAMVVLGVVSSAVLPMGGMGFGRMAARHGGDISIKTPDGEVAIDTAKMDAMGKKMEEAAKRMEAAQKSGDPSAAGKAMGEMMGAMTGAGGTPLPAQELKARLPEAIGDLKRESIEAESGQAMGFGGSTAKARYVAEGRSVQLSITDAGGLGGMAALAGWANMTVDKDTPEQIEKVYKQGGRTVHEEARKDGSRAEYTVVLGNGVIVAGESEKVDLATLKKIVDAVDLAKIEAMQRPAKP